VTISTRAFDGIKLKPGTVLVPFTGKPRYRSTAKPTGQPPMIDLIKAAQAAAMSMRRSVYGRGKE